MGNWSLKDSNNNVIFTSTASEFSFEYPENKGEKPVTYKVIYEDADCSSEATLTVKSCYNPPPGPGPEPPVPCKFTIRSNVEGAKVTWYVDSKIVAEGTIQNGVATIELYDVESVTVRISKENYEFNNDRGSIDCNGEIRLDGTEKIKCIDAVFNAAFTLEGLNNYDLYENKLGGISVDLDGQVDYWYPYCTGHELDNVFLTLDCSNNACSNAENSKKVDIKSVYFGEANNQNRLGGDISISKVLKSGIQVSETGEPYGLRISQNIQLNVWWGCNNDGSNYANRVEFTVTDVDEYDDSTLFIYLKSKNKYNNTYIEAELDVSVQVQGITCYLKLTNLEYLYN